MVALVIWTIAGKILVGFYGGKYYGLSGKAAVRAGLSLGQRGEFSAIIASMSPPQIRVFGGVYILITAFLGVYLFNKAPAWSKWFNEKYLKKVT